MSFLSYTQGVSCYTQYIIIHSTWSSFNMHDHSELFCVGRPCQKFKTITLPYSEYICFHMIFLWSFLATHLFRQAYQKPIERLRTSLRFHVPISWFEHWNSQAPTPLPSCSFSGHNPGLRISLPCREAPRDPIVRNISILRLHLSWTAHRADLAPDFNGIVDHLSFQRRCSTGCFFEMICVIPSFSPESIVVYWI